MHGRKYETTHPWIKFEVDLRSAPAQLWVLFGEAAAMIERVGAAPVRPFVSAQMHRLFFAKGVMATTAIEGNTLSEDQILLQLDNQLDVQPSQEYLKQETKNIIDACTKIWNQIISSQVPPLSSALFKDFNAQVLAELPNLGEEVVPGAVSEHAVVVGGVYKGAPREDCEYLLDRLAGWLDELGPNLWPDWSHRTDIHHAILKAVLAHLYVAWIHPFGDGNGRTARLVEFLILAAAGVPSPVAHLLSNHYNQTRTDYYRHLDRTSKTGGDVFGFLLYALQGLVDGLNVQLQMIQREHLEVAWQSYVLEHFRDLKRSEAKTRQRDLVLDLTSVREPKKKADMFEVSPRMARHYAAKTIKTISRDVNALVSMDLIRRVVGGYVPNTYVMLGFKPFSRETGEHPEVLSNVVDRGMIKRRPFDP